MCGGEELRAVCNLHTRKGNSPRGGEMHLGPHPPFFENHGRKEGLPATDNRLVLKAVSATTEIKVSAPSLSVVFFIHYSKPSEDHE